MTLLLSIAGGPAGAAPAGGSASKARDEKEVSVSLAQFTERALKTSLRSLSAEETLLSSRWSWLASLRTLTWPTLSGAANRTRSFSDSDTGVEAETWSSQESLTLRQPFLTGTSLSLNGTWSRSDTDTDTLGVLSESRNRDVPTVSASVSQPIFLFERNASLRSRRQANLRWANDQDSYRAERLEIEVDARALYYNLLLQLETAEVERKKFESAELVHRVTQSLVRAGKLARVELTRADIRAKRDQRRIQNVESNLQQTMNDAKRFILLPEDARLRLTSRLSYRPFDVPLNRLLDLAEKHNTTLLISERQVRLSEISLAQTREGDRPRFLLSGSYSKTMERSDPTAPVDPYSWQGQLGVEWSLFDATLTRLRTRQSEVSLNNTRRSYENQRRQLSVSVQNAYLDVKRAEDQIKEFGPQREAAERNVRAIRLQYQNGLTRLTDVFEAENDLRDLELEYLSLLVTFNTARDRLKRLVGIDWDKIEGQVQ